MQSLERQSLLAQVNAFVDALTLTLSREYTGEGTRGGHKCCGGLGDLGRNKAALSLGQAIAGPALAAQLVQKNGTIKFDVENTTCANSSKDERFARSR